MSNIEYLVNLLQISKIVEKPPKVLKGSPKRRRKLKRRSSEERVEPAEVAEAEPCEADAAEEAM